MGGTLIRALAPGWCSIRAAVIIMDHSGSFSKRASGWQWWGGCHSLHIPHALSWHEDSALPQGAAPFLPQVYGGALLPEDLSLVSEGHSYSLVMGI